MSSKVFSPSQTADWSRCPIYWQMRQAGWQSNIISKKGVGALTGTAFTRAMEHYNNIVKVEGFGRVREDATFQAKLIEQCLEVARVQLQGDVDKAFASGLSFEDTKSLDTMPATVETLVTRFIKNDPTPADWTVAYVEHAMVEHGYAKADVVYATPARERVVVDYKVKTTLNTAYLQSTLEEYGDGTQRHHYIWMHDAARFIIYLVVSAPFKVYEAPFERDDTRQAQWLEQQRVKWAHMEAMKAGTMQPWEADAHKDQYGLCEMHDACITYSRDEERMKVGGYIQIERGKRL